MIPRFATPEDKALVESICSDPEVRKWTAVDGAPPFSSTAWLKPPNMVVLVEGGCFLSNYLGDTTYGVHTNILPGHRGKAALEQANLALMLAFLDSPAESFRTMVPEGNKGAEWFTKAMGFRYTYTQHGKWVKDGKKGWLSHYTLDVDDWILQGHLAEVGRAFHTTVEEKLGNPSHEEDLVHDSYVGAALAMGLAGNVTKAIKIYNRWALTAGYAPLKILSLSPVVIDAQDFLIKLDAGTVAIEIKENEYA